MGAACRQGDQQCRNTGMPGGICTSPVRQEKTSCLATGCACARAIEQRELHASLTNGN
jgi:hypothetical protein